MLISWINNKTYIVPAFAVSFQNNEWVTNWKLATAVPAVLNKIANTNYFKILK